MTALPVVIDELDQTIESWKSNAACTGLPIDRFFASKGEKYDEVLELCKECPVIDDCLQYALDMEKIDGWRSGIYGGTTPGMRNRMFGKLKGRLSPKVY